MDENDVWKAETTKKEMHQEIQERELPMRNNSIRVPNIAQLLEKKMPLANKDFVSAPVKQPLRWLSFPKQPLFRAATVNKKASTKIREKRRRRQIVQSYEQNL